MYDNLNLSLAYYVLCSRKAIDHPVNEPERQEPQDPK